MSMSIACVVETDSKSEYLDLKELFKNNFGLSEEYEFDPKIKSIVYNYLGMSERFLFNDDEFKISLLWNSVPESSTIVELIDSYLDQIELEFYKESTKFEFVAIFENDLIKREFGENVFGENVFGAISIKLLID